MTLVTVHFTSNPLQVTLIVEPSVTTTLGTKTPYRRPIPNFLLFTLSLCCTYLLKLFNPIYTLLYFPSSISLQFQTSFRKMSPFQKIVQIYDYNFFVISLTSITFLLYHHTSRTFLLILNLGVVDTSSN